MFFPMYLQIWFIFFEFTKFAWYFKNWERLSCRSQKFDKMISFLAWHNHVYWLLKSSHYELCGDDKHCLFFNPKGWQKDDICLICSNFWLLAANFFAKNSSIVNICQGLKCDFGRSLWNQPTIPLCSFFKHLKVTKIFLNLGKSTKTSCVWIHFYQRSRF